MCGGDEDVLHGGVDPLENGEVQGPSALLVQVRDRFPTASALHLHLPTAKTLTLIFLLIERIRRTTRRKRKDHRSAKKKDKGGREEERGDVFKELRFRF